MDSEKKVIAKGQRERYPFPVDGGSERRTQENSDRGPKDRGFNRATKGERGGTF